MNSGNLTSSKKFYEVTILEGIKKRQADINKLALSRVKHKLVVAFVKY